VTSRNEGKAAMGATWWSASMATWICETAIVLALETYTGKSGLASFLDYLVCDCHATAGR